MRRTKIVATLGPASSDPPVLRSLLEAGADVLRINFSHGDRDEHVRTIKAAREAADAVGREVGLLGDIPGPKLRVGEIEGEVVLLESGHKLVLTTAPVAGTAERVHVPWAGLPEAVSPGTVIYLADGTIRLRVEEVRDGEVVCRVEIGGSLSSHKGLNLPGLEIEPPHHTDFKWVDFAVDHGIDLLAVSFVRRAEDLEPVSRRLKERGSDIPLIAKIEKQQAAANAEDIIEAAMGGIMVARGDLGIELPIERVPVVQKELLAAAGRQSRPSITATQMLASMVGSSRPTRAEATDVANAIFDGTDAVMLSEETAVGEYPVDAVRMMDAIARETEQHLPYDQWVGSRTSHDPDNVANTVAYAAVGAAYQLRLAALIVPTRSGRTARLVSAHRPRVPVLAISSRPETVRRLNLLWGVRCVHHEEWEGLSRLLRDSAEIARHEGVASTGDLVAITAGLPGQSLGTNMVEVHRVP